MSRRRCILERVLSPLAVFIFLGCGPKPVDIGRVPRSFQPADYRPVFEHWSRELRILPIDGVENVLTARATYLSHEFRLAYVVRVASDFRYTTDERRSLRSSEMGALGQRHEFFISLMSGVTGCDELDPEDGPWRIRLVDDRGRSVAPSEVVEIRKPTLADVKYFDFDSVHRKAYRLYFPIAAEDGQPILSEKTHFFSLNFSSAFSQGKMRWEIKANVL